MGNQASMPSNAATGAASVATSATAPSNSNLNAMNSNLGGILGAAGNVGSAGFKGAFIAFKATVKSSISREFQNRLLQINDSNSVEAIKAIRDDINAKVVALQTQFKELMSKMQRLPAATFETVNAKYSQKLSDVYASLMPLLKAKSSEAGKLIAKKEAESAKFAASFPEVPGAPGSSRLPELQARLNAFKKGGARRRRSVKRTTCRKARKQKA